MTIARAARAQWGVRTRAGAPRERRGITGPLKHDVGKPGRRLRADGPLPSHVMGTRPGTGAHERMRSLRGARDLMDLRFADPLDLDRIAEEAGFSKFHFARTFKDAYGETPAAYLSRRRVERAKDLLRAANLTVTEVCMLVGFSSLGSFSSRFSELVGMAPSEYQRRSAQRGGPPPIPGCYLMEWSRPRPPALRGGSWQERNGGEA